MRKRDGKGLKVYGVGFRNLGFCIISRVYGLWIGVRDLVYKVWRFGFTLGLNPKRKALIRLANPYAIVRMQILK